MNSGNKEWSSGLVLVVWCFVHDKQLDDSVKAVDVVSGSTGAQP